MPTQSVFHWLDGRGWLVFSGGASDDIRAQALGRAAADGGVACVALSGDPDLLLDDVADLGAPSGYVVDVLGEDDAALQDKLAQAGTVIIAGGDSPVAARGTLRGVPLEGIETAFANGGVILLEGESASAFGAWLVAGEEVEAGFEWLTGAAVLTGVGNAGEAAKPILAAQPTAIAVAILPGSALALGPDGQVETWGNREVTVALGAAYGT
jgi:hypothetical protein